MDSRMAEFVRVRCRLLVGCSVGGAGGDWAAEEEDGMGEDIDAGNVVEDEVGGGGV